MKYKRKKDLLQSFTGGDKQYNSDYLKKIQHSRAIHQGLADVKAGKIRPVMDIGEISGKAHAKKLFNDMMGIKTTDRKVTNDWKSDIKKWLDLQLWDDPMFRPTRSTSRMRLDDDFNLMQPNNK